MIGWMMVSLLLAAPDAPAAAGPRFYPDDPIQQMPAPLEVKTPRKRGINLLYDFVVNTVATPGERQLPGQLIPSQDVNTLGDVPDSEWYTRRHYWRRMTLDELRRGPAHEPPPVPPFRVTGAKTEGITPGFEFVDAKGRKYLAKADPISNPELASAADVIGSKFFYALGYNTPANYILYFTRDQVSISPDARFENLEGKQRPMRPWDFEPIIRNMRRDRQGRYRVVASEFIPGEGVGPARWYSTRKDDPNDIYRHEHRRQNRGMYVMCAWLNHTDIKAGQTYDTLITENGVPHLKHYLVDFGSMLGSDSDIAKDARFGHRYMVEKNYGVLAKMFFGGFYAEDWERADYNGKPSVGRFTAEAFHPDQWKTNYPNPAFINRLPDDDFWGAKQVMAFTNEEIRAIVETGEYTDPAAVDYIAGVLVQRRDMIGRTFFAKVLPLDRFEVRNGALAFHNLAADYGFSAAPRYEWEWAVFDNDNNRTGAVIGGADSAQVPAEARSGYVVATIRAAGEPPAKLVRVYVRGEKVVGIDRTW